MNRKIEIPEITANTIIGEKVENSSYKIGVAVSVLRKIGAYQIFKFKVERNLFELLLDNALTRRNECSLSFDMIHHWLTEAYEAKDDTPFDELITVTFMFMCCLDVLKDKCAQRQNQSVGFIIGLSADNAEKITLETLSYAEFETALKRFYDNTQS